MKLSRIQSLTEALNNLGLDHVRGLRWNLTPAELITKAIKNGEGVLTYTISWSPR
jgi:hypothetical protein